jgi:hypothetical protein
MIREPFVFRQTFATILADAPEHVVAAKKGMMAARQQIEAYIARDPFFRDTFDPYSPDSDDPVICRMASAARNAGVGPMAAVAGAIAHEGVAAMVAGGAHFGVIDNGGDIALVSNRNVRIGIHAGASSQSDKFAFVVPPQDTILGVCTSSATVGPSISFGVADAVSIFATDPFIADAWATAICNQIRADDLSVLDHIKKTDVTGVLAIIGDTLITWGKLPPIVPAVVDEQLISAGDRL